MAWFAYSGPKMGREYYALLNNETYLRVCHAAGHTQRPLPSGRNHPLCPLTSVQA